MNSEHTKYFVLALSLTLIFMATFFYLDKNSKKVIVKKAVPIAKTQPLQYSGSTILNKFNKKNVDNYQTAAGTYDSATMASTVTNQILKAFSNTTEKTLPLVANWNAGIPQYSDGLDPMYMIDRLANGEHILPSWKLAPYYDDTIGLDYYEASIKKAAELGLPLIFILPSPESALTKDDVYFSMDKTQNPNVITTSGIVLPKLSPFSPNALWNEVGEQWSSTSLMAQLQEWYPNPPLVLFIDEDTSAKLSWSELSSSSRYAENYSTSSDDEFKRNLVNAAWVEKYRQLHNAIKKGFTKDTWTNNIKFVSRNQLASNMGRTSAWLNSATSTNQYANIWSHTTDALTINFNLDDTTAYSDINNFPFMLDEAKQANPNFTYELSINANSTIDNPQQYRGLTQFALWFLRPSIIRQTTNQTIKDEINPLFQQVVDSVDLVNDNEILADFWKNGKLLKTGESTLNINVPMQYQTIPRWFLLKTDSNQKVLSFTIEKGEAPNREWLIYAQSPEDNLTDVTVTIPNYKNILIDVTTTGSFYIYNENLTSTQTITSNYDTNSIEADKVQSIMNSLILSTLQAREDLKNYKPDLNTNYGKEFFVSTMGNDNNPGTIDSPFKTLQKARDSVRAYKNANGIPSGGIVVWIREGTYQLTTTFELTEQDSGEQGNPIVYSAYRYEKVRLVGGVDLDPSWFQSVTTNDSLWDRLDLNARDHIKVVDLAAHGITDLGTLNPDSYAFIAPLEIFQNGQALNLARWPDYNETTAIMPSLDDTEIHIYGNLSPDITGTYMKQNTKTPVYIRDGLVDGRQYYIRRIDPTDRTKSSYWRIRDGKGDAFWSYLGDSANLPREFTTRHGSAQYGVPSLLQETDKQFGFALMTEGINDTSFKINSDRLKNWINTGNIWINGMFKYAWSNAHKKIKNIDKQNNIITLESSPTYGIKKGQYKQPFYVYNLIEELTTPSEYFIDRKASKLYIWALQNTLSGLTASMNNKSLIYLNNASWNEFHNLDIEIGRAELINISKGKGNLIAHCNLKNSGKQLIKISGYNNGLSYSNLSAAGEEDVSIKGGIRATLTPSNNFVKNNYIHGGNRWKWTYRGAMRIDGVGNIIEHNDIHNFLHLAIHYTGNNNRIKYNTISDVLQYAEDSGAIYSGRQWAWRNNQINYNFIYNIKNNYRGSSIYGIYFDDSLSGNEDIGNILYNIDGGGVLLNGGRDTTTQDNLFYKVETCYVGTNYGIKSINNIKGSSFNFLERLKEDNVNYQSETWKNSYPRLAKIPNNWSQIQNNGYLLPGGNIFTNNEFVDVLRIVREATVETSYDKGNFEYYQNIDTNSTNTINLPFSSIGIKMN